jgi:hypothetical protein
VVVAEKYQVQAVKEQEVQVVEVQVGAVQQV